MAHDPSASVDVSADPEPGTVHAVSFGVVRRGYDPHQVDPVLAELAEQIDSLQAQVAELREREADLLAALDAADDRVRAAEATTEDLTAALAAALRSPEDEDRHDHRAEGEVVDAPAAGDAAVTAAPEVSSSLAPVDGRSADVAAMVGEETARIVEAARHAAVEIGARAREEAERIVAEAREEARSIRAEAEVQLLHRTREADDAVAARLLEAADAVQEAQTRAESIIDDAFTEAATVVLRAREEADAAVAAGEQKGRELTDAAVAARDELLGDLVRRRKVLRRQVEQLEAGRARLRDAYTVVEVALAEATGELDRTVPEARDAALAAVERADAADDPELRAAVAALGADPDAVVGAVEGPAAGTDPTTTDPATAPADVTPATAGAVDPPAGHEALPATDAPPTGSDAPDPEPTVGDDAEPTASGTTPATRGADTAAGAPTTSVTVTVAGADIDLRATPGPAGADDADAEAATVAEPKAAVATDGPTEPAARRRRRRAPDPVEFEGRWSSAVRVLPPGAETADPALADASTASARAARARPTTSATELFARLRAGGSHQPSLFDPSGPGVPDRSGAGDGDRSATAAGTGGPPEASGASPDLEAAWIARRDAAFAPSLRALRRRLKATLADDEDSLLEAVRRSEPVPPTIDALRDARARRDDLAVALVTSLVTAADAGTELATSAPAEARVAEAAGASGVGADEVAVELADAVVAPLDERLERCIARYHRSITEAAEDPDLDQTEAADAAMASLVSSIKAAYRARRGAQVQIPTEHAVLLVGHRGLVGALRPGTPLRWVVAPPSAPARRGASADGTSADPGTGVAARVCASCVAVADVGAGDPFGHGPLLPPARPGCRCAVAPVSAVVPRRP